MTIVDTLKTSDMFHDLSDKELEKIAAHCRSRIVKLGGAIFTEGEPADEFFLLVEGKATLDMALRPVPGRPVIPTAVDVITQGDSLGWSSLVPPFTYTLTARCMTPCRVLAIKGDVLRKAMEDDPVLGFRFMTSLVILVKQRLRHTRLRLTSGLGLIVQ